MPNWPTQPLGELCQLINGRAFKPSDWGKEGLRIVRIQNLNDHEKPFNHFAGDYQEKHRIDDGEILLSWSGTPGTSFGCFRWQRGPGLLNQHIFRVEVEHSIIDGDFFIYAVNSKLDEMIRQAHGGVGLRHITKGKLEAIHLPVPSLDEQQRIVNRIRECLNRTEEIRTNENLIAPELAAVFPSILNQRFQELVAMTEPAKLEDVAEIRGGQSLPKGSPEDYGENTALLVKVGDMNAEGNERIIATSRAFLSMSEVGRGLVPAGAVIFPKRGGAIATNKKRLLGRPALLDPNLMAVVAKPDVTSPSYLYYWCQTLDLNGLSNGGVIPQLNRKDLAPLNIPLPDLDAQERIVAELETTESACSELKKQFQAASEERSHLRDSILRRVIGGEL